MSVLRLLLVDDHPVYRNGLRALLGGAADVEVVGEAADGDAAVAVAARLTPDVVLMDLHLPGRDGISATRDIVAGRPEAAVLVLTMSEADATVWAAMRAGARGYLLKDADGTEIIAAVRAVGRGELVFGPGIAGRVLDFFARAPERTGVDHPFPELTPRERDVLELLAGGRSNPEIARRLTLSPKTVRNLVSSVFAKLQVADRAQAIVLAREAGLGRDATGPSPG